MIKVARSSKNPILFPNSQNDWETKAVFNGCPVYAGRVLHLLYRAVSAAGISSVGICQGNNELNFERRRQLIVPEYDFEKYGVEDPIVTKFEGNYYIFYTALSTMPLSPAGIKIGVAKTGDFLSLEKHPVTTFTSKAMALFPNRVNGKIAAVLTVNTDMPPSKIALAFFDSEEEIWSSDYWEDFYSHLDEHRLSLARSFGDQLEVGAPPVKTEDGWLLIYSYIRNYFSDNKIFGIEAVLLDLDDPLKIIGRTKQPLMIPQEDYELSGNVPNVIFPSGALMEGKNLLIYYGACDTTCCLATVDLAELLVEIKKSVPVRLQRFSQNPIILPIEKHLWEAKATFNPGVIMEGGRVHIVYRAMSKDNVSVFGYAQSVDGFHVSQRFNKPIYVPRASFEIGSEVGNFGCEDPRITKIDESIYMCYTAYDGKNYPRIALTSITVDDFLGQRWNWREPVLISPAGIDDKDGCILGEKVNGKYVIFHRIDSRIWIDFVDELDFDGKHWVLGEAYFDPRGEKWDSQKIGIAAPPIKCDKGWLVLYHGVSHEDHKYRLGAMLLDWQITGLVARSESPIFEPEVIYEKEGQVPYVVFCCGAVVIDGTLFVYYGAADRVVGVATVKLSE